MTFFSQLLTANFAKPVVTREPATQKALRYGNVTLTCDAASSSDSLLVISWRKDNEVSNLYVHHVHVMKRLHFCH